MFRLSYSPRFTLHMSSTLKFINYSNERKIPSKQLSCYEFEYTHITCSTIVDNLLQLNLSQEAPPDPPQS